MTSLFSTSEQQEQFYGSKELIANKGTGSSKHQSKRKNSIFIKACHSATVMKTLTHRVMATAMKDPNQWLGKLE